MRTFTDQELDAALKRAPQAIQDELNSGEDTADVISSIRRQYGLHVDVSSMIAQMNRNMLLGLISPEQFYAELVALKIPEAQARAIMEEINTKIFVPLRDKIRGQGATAPRPAVPSYAPPQAVPPAPARSAAPAAPLQNPAPQAASPERPHVPPPPKPAAPDLRAALQGVLGATPAPLPPELKKSPVATPLPAPARPTAPAPVHTVAPLPPKVALPQASAPKVAPPLPAPAAPASPPPTRPGHPLNLLAKQPPVPGSVPPTRSAAWPPARSAVPVPPSRPLEVPIPSVPASAPTVPPPRAGETLQKVPETIPTPSAAPRPAPEAPHPSAPAAKAYSADPYREPIE